MKYNVYITRTYKQEFVVDADSAEEALDLAQEAFEELEINGYEMLQYEEYAELIDDENDI